MSHYVTHSAQKTQWMENHVLQWPSAKCSCHPHQLHWWYVHTSLSLGLARCWSGGGVGGRSIVSVMIVCYHCKYEKSQWMFANPLYFGLGYSSTNQRKPAMQKFIPCNIQSCTLDSVCITPLRSNQWLWYVMEFALMLNQILKGKYM